MSTTFRAFRYISIRRLHDRKLPAVLERFVSVKPVGYIGTESPKKADYPKPVIATTNSVVNYHSKKNHNDLCCGEADNICFDCPYNRYD